MKLRHNRDPFNLCTITRAFQTQPPNSHSKLPPDQMAQNMHTTSLSCTPQGLWAVAVTPSMQLALLDYGSDSSSLIKKKKKSVENSMSLNNHGSSSSLVNIQERGSREASQLGTWDLAQEQLLRGKWVFRTLLRRLS